MSIALVAIYLRFHALDRESLWFDEGWTWWLTSLPAASMMRIIRGDVVAPAYFYLLHVWSRAFGDGVVGLRSLSALLSTLALWPFVWIARSSWHGLPARDAAAAMPPAEHGLVAHATPYAATALLAVSTIQVQFARDARPYALLLCATLGALAFAIRAAERRSPRAIGGFVACVALGLYTHNMMAFTLVGLAGAWLAWPGGRSLRGRCVDLAIAGACVAICYAPWLPTLREQARWISGRFWLSAPTLDGVVADAGEIVGVLDWAVPGVAWERFGVRVRAETIARLTCAAAAAGVALALLTRDARQRRIAVALASVALVPPALVFGYGLVAQPLFVPRLFIASNAAIALLVAMPLAPGRPRVVRLLGGGVALVLLALMSLSTFTFLSSPQKEDWRGAYAHVARLPPSPRRLLVFVAAEGELPFAFYAAHDASRVAEARTGAPGGFFDLDPPQTIRRVLGDGDLASLRAQLASGRWDEVVLVLGHDAFSDPAGRTEAMLRSRLSLVDEWSSRYVRVLRFDARKLSS